MLLRLLKFQCLVVINEITKLFQFINKQIDVKYFALTTFTYMLG